MSESSKLEQQDALHAPEEPPHKKRKGPKGPNPLSMKKKKARPDARQADRAEDGHAGGQRDPCALAGPKDGKGDVNADRVLDVTEASASRPAEGTMPDGPRGHKRKRRRKGAQVQAAGDVAADDSESD
jgi:U3 small nucleolar RNA-associated protein 23